MWNLIFCSWVMAISASLGSLFFSEIMNYAPCTLCWYQRICLYPLVIILPLGLFPLDKKVIRYTLPLVIIGAIIAFYQNLLYYKVIPETLSPCRQGVSCTAVYFEWFGFVSIPLLALAGFVVILILLLMAERKANRE